MGERLYTVAEAAKLFNVSKKTIYRWTWKGKLKVIKLPSGGVRIPESEIKKYLGGGSNDIGSK